MHKVFDRSFGGFGNDELEIIKQTNDGGYLLGGSSYSGASGNKSQSNWDPTLKTEDFWIVKVDSIGNKQWDKRFGGNYYDALLAMQRTTDKGYILCGLTDSDPSGDKTQTWWGGEDFWLVKIDSLGNKQWDKSFGGTKDDIPLAVIQTMDGGYMLGGLSNSGISGDKTEDNWDTTYIDHDFWVVKTDSLGNKEWDRTFGGIKEDILTAIVQIDEHSYLLGGYSGSDSSGNKSKPRKGVLDYWIIKIDEAGNKIWDKSIGGPGENAIHSILKINDGGFLLAGHSSRIAGGDKTKEGGGSENYWIIKVDSIGNRQWDNTYGGEGFSDLSNIVETKDGGFLLSGRTDAMAGGDKTEPNLGQYQVWLVKTDSLGTKEWDKTILTVGSAFGQAIQSKDGCYVVGELTGSGIGGYKTQPNWDITNKTSDYWIVKFCDTAISGIDEISNNIKVVVSPNPVTTDIAITLQKDGLHEAYFNITNTLGQPVYSRRETTLSSSYTKMLDLSYLPGGIYFVEVVVDGERVVRQVVKE